MKRRDFFKYLGAVVVAPAAVKAAEPAVPRVDEFTLPGGEEIRGMTPHHGLLYVYTDHKVYVVDVDDFGVPRVVQELE